MSKYPPDSTFIITDLNDTKHTLYVADNFVRVSREKATYTIGELRDIGYVSAIKFKTGLPDYMDRSTFLNSSTSNDLTIDPDSLHSEDLDYTVQRLKIARGIEFTDTVIYDVPAELGFVEVAIELDTTYEAGREKVVNLTVDYQKWFEDINFEMETTTEDIAKLKNNLARAFQAK